MTKQKLIKEIKRIYNEIDTGSITMSEMGADHSPIAGSLGTTAYQLVETLYEDRVETQIYVNDRESDGFEDVSYEDLPQDCLEDIHELLENHLIGLDKTMDKIRDENF